MAKDVFKVLCPCCGKHIEINVRTGKARAAKPKEANQGTDLDSLIDKHKSERERLADVFNAATRDHTRDRDRLEDLFDAAKKDAAEDDAKPPNPFDLE